MEAALSVRRGLENLTWITEYGNDNGFFSVVCREWVEVEPLAPSCVGLADHSVLNKFFDHRRNVPIAFTRNCSNANSHQ